MSFGANLNLAGQIFPITIGYVYDPIGMSYVPAQQAGGGVSGAVSILDGFDVAQGTTTDAPWVSGSGTVISLLKKIASGGGSAVSIADGSDVALGAKADAAWNGVAGAVTLMSVQKYVAGLLDAIRVLLAGTLIVTGPLTDVQLRANPVPVSLPGGLATSVKQDTGNTSLGSIDTKLTGVALDGVDVTGSVMPTGGVGIRGWLSAIYGRLVTGIAVTGTFWQAIQPVSGTVDLGASSLAALESITVQASALPLNAAQEAGGNLAAIAANTGLNATASNQASELVALALLDTDLKAELGVVGSAPGAFTVLDRLNVLGQKIDAASKVAATDATLKQLLIAAKPAPGQSSVRATLLHR